MRSSFLFSLSFWFFITQAFNTAFGQDLSNSDDVMEVFVIDSYVTPEIPHKFILTYFTSDSATSIVVLENEFEFIVNPEYSDFHEIEIDLTEFVFDSIFISYRIIGKGLDQKEFKSERYEVTLPYKDKLLMQDTPGFFSAFCLGALIFMVPSPALVIYEDQSFLSLSKELPVISFYSTGYNYPNRYLALEYAYVFNSPLRNFLRAGYKEIFQVPYIEYISGGINIFTDFLGFNGLSPEVSIGFFKFYKTFTVYSKYRYNFKPGHNFQEFHEISIGLFSNFFSLQR